jgi:hypothetical protein
MLTHKLIHGHHTTIAMLIHTLIHGHHSTIALRTHTHSCGRSSHCNCPAHMHGHRTVIAMLTYTYHFIAAAAQLRLRWGRVWPWPFVHFPYATTCRGRWTIPAACEMGSGSGWILDFLPMISRLGNPLSPSPFCRGRWTIAASPGMGLPRAYGDFHPLTTCRGRWTMPASLGMGLHNPVLAIPAACEMGSGSRCISFL